MIIIWIPSSGGLTRIYQMTKGGPQGVAILSTNDLIHRMVQVVDADFDDLDYTAVLLKAIQGAALMMGTPTPC